MDSLGKPPSGILEGAIDWIGEYSECINSTNSIANWTAKYCSVNTDNIPQPLGPNNQKLMFTYGLCSPSVCTREDIAAAVNFSKFIFNNFSN